MDKVFNDCVHGHICLPAVCVMIIDTLCFQRLRNIKQVGTGYYVYPGAVHHRFEHCLGVCYLTGQMITALNKNTVNEEMRVSKHERICLEIAALCHDLGHGPFSHTWEEFMKRIGVSFSHEECSTQLLDVILQEKKIKTEFKRLELEDKHIEFIKNLILGKKGSSLNGKKNRDFLYEIICNKPNGIDVDKWDYLLRDGKQLNLNITFDYRRLLEFTCVVETSDGENHICYRDKEAFNILQMFKARAELHYIAYQHRVVKAIEEMLLDALVDAHNNGYRFQGCELSKVHEDPEVYQKITDHIYYDILCSTQQDLKGARSLLERIQCRDLYQHLHTISPKDASVEKNLRAMFENNTNIVVSKLEVKVDKNLPYNVYLFDKTNLNKAQHYIDWKYVPVFPVDMENLQRVKLFVYAKERLEEASLQEVKDKIASCIDQLSD